MLSDVRGPRAGRPKTRISNRQEGYDQISFNGPPLLVPKQRSMAIALK